MVIALVTLIGIASLVFGVLLLVMPDRLERFNSRIQRIVLIDIYAIKYHRIVGITLLSLAGLLLYYGIVFRL